jgi:sensor c-di-GMP phosphodiesterase-like protein
MRNGEIVCSAFLGRLAQPRTQQEPDFTQQDDTRIYKNLPPYQNGSLDSLALQQGDSYVVSTPTSRIHLEPASMHFTETAKDVPSQKVGRLFGESPPSLGSILTTEGQSSLGENLYATRCSTRFFNCVTVYTSIPEALQADRVQFVTYIALCGLIGGFSGFFWSVIAWRNRSMEKQLRRAVKRDDLRVVYQPIVNLATRRIVGAEALSRWTDEDGRVVGPDVFIKMAEERGFVGPITELVLHHALRDFQETIRRKPDFHLSINVAASDLRDPGFLSMLQSSLEEASVPAKNVSIEITERSTVRDDVVAMESIRCLRERGHSIHIDDFGTGYSSLSYLHDLSVNAIKIDRAFTQAIGTDAATVAILPQILAMAESLKLQVIVEGVETNVQAKYFGAMTQPVLAQGWLFGRPIPAADFYCLLAEERKHMLVPAQVA